MTRAARLLAPLLLLAATLFLVLFAGACIDAPCGEAHHGPTVVSHVSVSTGVPLRAGACPAAARFVAVASSASPIARVLAPALRPTAGPERLRI